MNSQAQETVQILMNDLDEMLETIEQIKGPNYVNSLKTVLTQLQLTQLTAVLMREHAFEGVVETINETFRSLLIIGVQSALLKPFKQITTREFDEFQDEIKSILDKKTQHETAIVSAMKKGD